MGRKTLHAAGFNAWGQASFEPPSSAPEDQPEDLHSFTPVLVDCRAQPTDVTSFSSYSLVTTTKETLIMGNPPGHQRALYSAPRRDKYVLFTEAANGKVAIKDNDWNLRVYRSAQEMLCETNSPLMKFSGFYDVMQLVAYEVGFAALDRTGQVFTWGDERYASCLGREVTEESPADAPHLVPDLNGLPTGIVKKIAANGYMLAALTEEGDLYCWGYHHPAVAHVSMDLRVTPNLVDIAGKSVLDVGVGDSHLIVLTDDRQVWVIGDNKHCQLGLGIEVKDVTEWTLLDLPLGKKDVVIAVRAGPKNSFLITEHNRKEEQYSKGDLRSPSV